MTTKYITDEQKKELLSLDYRYITATQIAELFGKTLDKTDPSKFKIKEPKFDTSMKMKLKANEYINKTDIETHVGIFLFNKLLIEGSIERIIPNGYYNEIINNKKWNSLLDIVADATLNKKISITDELYDFLKRFEFWSLKLVSVFSPSFSANIISPNKEIDKVKEDLYKDIENKSMTQMVNAEDKLVDMADKILDKDSGKRIFKSGARGSFENDYKNMIISVGPTQNPITGEYDFMKSSYLGGISKEDLPTAGNIIINSEYPKAKGTAEGGYIVKQFIAIFQTMVFGEKDSDCKTTNYLDIKLTESNASSYIDQYIKTDKGLVLLSLDNIHHYIGTTIHLRSPLYCKSDKICNKCAGERYYKLGIEATGITASDIGSNILNAGMKLRHNLKIKLDNIDIDEVLK